jgi:hypothetical protein
MAIIADPKAEILGTLAHGNKTIVARKKFRDHSGILSTLPLHDTDFFRKLFKEAGCHIYNEANDFTYANSGLILLHTRYGGHRTIHLLNGRTIDIEVPAFSTFLLDASRGNILLK